MSLPQPLPENVTLITSNKPGPSIAIMAGVHGNERGGIEALTQLATSLRLEYGSVLLILANPAAVAAGKRMLEKNLNRVFLPDNGTSPEDIRARQLMPLLDACEMLLDLHTFNDPAGEPFVICEDSGLELARKLAPTLVSTNWTEVEPGSTDGYMHTQGKIGICIEAGPTDDVAASTAAALDAAMTVLKAYGMVDGELPERTEPKRHIRALRTVLRTDDDFYLNPDLTSFQDLEAGQVIGRQAGVEFVAAAGECIIFPRPDAPMGAEAFIIGRHEKLEAN